MIIGLILDVVKGIRHMTKGTHMNITASTMRLQVGDVVAIQFSPNGTVERTARITAKQELERGLYVLDLTMGEYTATSTSLADELWQVTEPSSAANTAKL